MYTRISLVALVLMLLANSSCVKKDAVLATEVEVKEYHENMLKGLNDIGRDDFISLYQDYEEFLKMIKHYKPEKDFSKVTSEEFHSRISRQYDSFKKRDIDYEIEWRNIKVYDYKSDLDEDYGMVNLTSKVYFEYEDQFYRSTQVYMLNNGKYQLSRFKIWRLPNKE